MFFCRYSSNILDTGKEAKIKIKKKIVGRGWSRIRLQNRVNHEVHFSRTLNFKGITAENNLNQLIAA